jgi:hypothetical protein
MSGSTAALHIFLKLILTFESLIIYVLDPNPSKKRDYAAGNLAWICTSLPMCEPSIDFYIPKLLLYYTCGRP